MGGGDKRPEDSNDTNEYEDREPDGYQVDFDSIGNSGSGSEGPTTLSNLGSGIDNPVDRVQQYAKQGNDGSNNISSDGDDRIRGGGLSASQSLLAITGLGMSVGTRKPTIGEWAVDISEKGVERLYEQAREEVSDE